MQIQRFLVLSYDDSVQLQKRPYAWGRAKMSHMDLRALVSQTILSSRDDAFKSGLSAPLEPSLSTIELVQTKYTLAVCWLVDCRDCLIAAAVCCIAAVAP